MGWVNFLSVLLIVQLLLLSLHGDLAKAQLWAPEPWEPERRAKSLGFLGRDEASKESIENNSIAGDEDEKQEKEDKKAILNVSDKDSPYALIDKYFPERESYFYQNRRKFQTEYHQQPADKREDIGHLDPSEVWLAEDSLLVLKGGSTPNRSGFDNPWTPIDDFQAPYREPVLPPPDFDPDTLDIGVGVPIETILAERARKKKDDLYTRVTSAPRHFAPPQDNSLDEGKRTRDSVDHKTSSDPLKPFKDEVDDAQEEFKLFLDDVSKYISDMENFHSVKQQSASKTLVRTLPPPSSPSSTYSPYPTPTTTPRPSSPTYPISYASPNAKVYLSTQYVTHPPSPSSSPAPEHQSHRKQARSTQVPPVRHTSPSSSSTPAAARSVSPLYRERSSTTPVSHVSSPVSVVSGEEDWTPVTTSPPVIRNYNREQEFKTVVKQLPPRATPAPVIHSVTPPDVHHPVVTTPAPAYTFSPVTPYSVFQSVPENIQETDVFHLSQNVDFGKKIGSPPHHRPPQHSVAYNEIDTGARVSKGRYTVQVTTKPPVRRPHRVTSGGVEVAGVSLDRLLPGLFTGHRSRSRTTVRRRRPKFIEQRPVASDRQGSGDVRYVSFVSGVVGGNSWGYSYNLG